MTHNTNNNCRGFTLIETLVAFLMLTVGIAPSFFVMVSSMGLGERIRSNLTAANLAQEGIEVVRAIRDGNWFNAVSFDDNLTSRCAPPFGCMVQWNTQSGDASWPQTLASANVPYMRFDAATGIYSHVGGTTDSPFRRHILITPLPGGGPYNELKVQSIVEWQERGSNISVTVESHITDWK